LCSTSWAPTAHAQSQNQAKQYTIFDIRRNLPLKENETVYRDYYVNLGADEGVKEGAILSVYRRVPVTDIYRNKTHADLVVPIGHMKVILAQKSMSVAREASLVDQAQIPVVQYEKIMLGDRVEVALAPTQQEPKQQEKTGEAAPLPQKQLAPQKALPVKRAVAESLPMNVKQN
jgi:hypothetical protein